MTNQEKIENIIKNSSYSLYEIKNINEYNAKQFEVELYDGHEGGRFYLDINLYEMTMCEINIKTRKRVAYQDIQLDLVK